MKEQQILLLRWLTFSVFIGRAWQHLFWDIPLRELLWDEAKMTGFVNHVLGMNWGTYISSMTVNAWIEGISVGFGVFYLLSAIAALVAQPKRKWTAVLIIIGIVSLCFLAFLNWLEKFMSIGQLLEFALQIGTPLFLYWTIFKPQKRLVLFIKIAIALTFIGHGLYALGWYPVPVHFVQMLINTFGIEEQVAMTFLKIAGILDLVIAVGIFVPQTSRACLWYCVIWGTMTAFARLVANFDGYIPLESLHRWWFEVVFRLVHGGIPLLLLLVGIGKVSDILKISNTSTQ